MKTVNRILTSPTSGLENLLERAATLQRIGNRFAQFLDHPMNEHVQLANLRDNSAIIIADSAVWLTKARYLAPQILSFLRQEPGLESLKKIHFKVQPAQVDDSSHLPSTMNMSHNTADLLVSTSESISDPKLKGALAHLARRYQSKE